MKNNIPSLQPIYIAYSVGKGYYEGALKGDEGMYKAVLRGLGFRASTLGCPMWVFPPKEVVPLCEQLVL